MKNLRLLFLTAFVLFSCDNTPNPIYGVESDLKFFKGDLYFKLIDIGSLYNAPDSAVQHFEAIIAGMKAETGLSEDEKLFIQTIELLKKEKLLDKPYIKMKFDSQTVTVYLNEEDFEEVKDYNLDELLRENRKVEISFEGRVIDNGIIKCEKLHSTIKTAGQTEWKK
jgi:hypothetical protein